MDPGLVLIYYVEPETAEAVDVHDQEEEELAYLQSSFRVFSQVKFLQNLS
jgi:hypothetical protein